VITLTVTFQDFNSHMTLGDVRNLLLDNGSTLVTPEQWALLRPRGSTPSSEKAATQDQDRAGRSAEGESTGGQREPSDCCLRHQPNFKQSRVRAWGKEYACAGGCGTWFGLHWREAEQPVAPADDPRKS
jgi:hypothetical protein